MNPLLLTGIFELGKGLIDKFFPDPEAKAKAQLELVTLQQNGYLQELGMALQRDLAQAETNKVEAASPNVFVSGWRPGIGWVCTLALSYQFLIRPLLPWVLEAQGLSVPDMPSLDENLWELVFSMLGFGGLRTFEKLRGVTK